MKNKILLFIISILLINCNGQDKENEKKENKINFLNSTFLGVDKINGLNVVYNRCDGGYPILRFNKNEFYFYSPQEGVTYIIEQIKGNNDNYIVYTSGYYFLKTDPIIKHNDTWYFKKQDDLLWTFKNEDWGENTILTDSLNISKKKISYLIQPCRECFDDCNEEATNNIIGQWSKNCDDPIGITLKDNNELIITVEPNQYYIHLIKIEDNNEPNIIKYKLKQLDGLGSKEINSDVYFNNKEVAVIKILGNDKIEFNWLGFYNNVNKQRQYSESQISDENPTVLSKCD